MNKQAKTWLSALLIGVAGIYLLFALLRPEEIAVDIGTVSRQPLAVTIQEQGRTRARYRYTVAAPITGRLLRSPLDEGDRVQRGDIVANIAPPPEDPRAEAILRAAVAVAEARQAEAQAHLLELQGNYDRARRELVRRRDLYEKKLIDTETLDLYAQTADASRARLASAEAAVAAADAELEAARSHLLGVHAEPENGAAIAVHSPVTGTVLRIFEESERVVAAGTALIELSEGDTLELVIDLLTEEAVQVHPGDHIQISGWGGDRTLAGVVRHIEPGAFTKISTLGVEEQRVNVIADLAEAAPMLGAEYRIEAAIEVWAEDDVLTIPTSAIFRRQNAWYTFVVEAGRARSRAIGIGRRGAERAQVLDGVSEGDRVVEFPSDLVIDGVKVIRAQR